MFDDAMGFPIISQREFLATNGTLKLRLFSTLEFQMLVNASFVFISTTAVVGTGMWSAKNIFFVETSLAKVEKIFCV